MNWFSELSNLSLPLILMLGAALLGGALALIFRKKAKPILIATGIFEAAVLAGALLIRESSVFEDVSLSSGAFTALILLLVVAMIAVMILSGRKQKWTARELAAAAMCVAMSFLLSLVKLYELPQGGTITPASLLPMTLYIVAFGPARGLVVGFAYGLLQLVQGAYVIHPIQLLADYPMAFGALALGGFARYLRLPKAFKLPAAVILGYLGRYVMAVLSGVVFFADYAGQQNVWIYSTVYNLAYLGPDCLVCAAVALIPAFPRLCDLLEKRA